MKKSHITIITLLLIALIFALAALFYNKEKNTQANQMVSKHSESLVRDHSVRTGNPQAKVTIVEFLDPACGTCRQFHPLVKELIEQNTDKVNLVIRYAPLHHGSDQMVAILEAAKMQEQFWQVLDMMFDTQPQWAINHRAHPEIFWKHLTQTNSGLDFAKLQQDMSDPAVFKAIQQDIMDGQLLGASKTPTFFVNGKPLPSFGYTQLQNLVKSEVSANY